MGKGFSWFLPQTSCGESLECVVEEETQSALHEDIALFRKKV